MAYLPTRLSTIKEVENEDNSDDDSKTATLDPIRRRTGGCAVSVTYPKSPTPAPPQSTNRPIIAPQTIARAAVRHYGTGGVERPTAPGRTLSQSFWRLFCCCKSTPKSTTSTHSINA